MRRRGTVWAVVSVDLGSARLVPAGGADGWLCRLPGAVVWLPEGNGDAGELIGALLSAAGPSELLGQVGSRLADPGAALWPPFAIVAQRGPDLVVVVHGPVEVVAEQGGNDVRLYGGDEAGSWLNRMVRGAGSVRGAREVADDGLVDLREGVVRAGGFLLLPVGALARSVGARGADVMAPTAAAVASDFSKGASPVAGERSSSAARPLVAPSNPAPAPAKRVLDADSPTVREQVGTGYEATVVEAGGAPRGGVGGGAVRPAVLGRLSWDNGEIHELHGAVLVGRDVAADDGVLAGELMGLTPGGQNDSMSRVHAELRPRGTDVLVIDRGSTNGTFAWDEGSRAWQRLVAGQPQAVPGGTVLAFGERTATFESATHAR
ncbi:MAG TPA: FHA domain-containing protein [Acidimicrobiales bacterium]|nr:FHA domain-containing protein [Acidimicrobiales bacterium]